MALPSNQAELARRVWLTEESAFVAGEEWRPVGGAQAIVHAEVPEVWDASFVSRVPVDANPRVLLDEARRYLVRNGCGHMKILMDDPDTCATVGLALSRRGLFRRLYATLCIDEVPAERAAWEPVSVEPVHTGADRRTLSRVRDEVRRQAPWYTRDVSKALDTWEDVQQASLDLTWLVAYFKGRPAGAAGLLVTADGASLQSLATVPSLRRRGIAGALIRDVVRRGLAEGAPFVSLLTDAHDFPRRLYQRMGFKDVGQVHEYLQAIC